MITREYYLQRVTAQALVYKAIRDGRLVRLESCELCGKTPESTIIKSERGKIKRAGICAHHWAGHDKPLEVWWLCHSCNSKLLGEKYHNGSITKEEAREIVIKVKPVKELEFCQEITRAGLSCTNHVTKGQKICYSHLQKRKVIERRKELADQFMVSTQIMEVAKELFALKEKLSPDCTCPICETIRGIQAK